MQLRTQLLLLTAASGLLSSSAAAQAIQDAQRLNTNGFNPNGNNRIDGAVIAQHGNSFYAAWAEQFGTTEFTQDIYFSRSTDDGANWNVPVRVDLGDLPNANDSDLPKIAVSDSGAIVVVWEESRDAFAQQSTNDDLFYNRSTDGGVTWMASSLPLNTATAGANILSDIDRAWLSVSGNTFHVTWEEDTLTALGGSEEVWYTRSTDAGATWSTPIIVSNNAGSNDVDEPKVEADGNLAVICYIDAADDVIAHRSTDGGATWSTGVPIESDPNGNADEAIIEVRGNTVVIAWTEQDPGTPGGEGAHVAISQDGGVTWLNEETLSLRQVNTVGGDADFPKIAIQSANNIFVTYSEDSVFVSGGGATGSSSNECMIAYTNNGGQTWTKDVPLWAGVVSNRPVVAATDDVVVVWLEQNANGSNIGAFTYSLDNGATWAPPQTVPSTGPDVDEGCNPDEGRYIAINPVTNTVMVTHMDRPLGQNEVYVSGILFNIGLGTNYCQALANSTGQAAQMTADGTRFIADNNVRLVASSLPLNAFGFFLTSRSQGLVMNPGGSQGNLCLTGSIGRYVGAGQIKNSGAQGEISLQLSLSSMPTPTGLVSAMSGDTWNFTAWYRDSVNGLATSNFADGLEISFQ
ncbi:MAG: sialidase family protein [Planctomycetota bacterium]